MVRVGDVANSFVILNTFAFMATVVAQTLGYVDVLSPAFQSDGFCVSWKETPLIQSHILCFYSDTVCALVLMLLAWRYKNMQGFAPVAGAAAGVFGHGAAHAGLWNGTIGGKPGDSPAILTEMEKPLPLLGAVIGLWAFFYFLMKSIPTISTKVAATHGLVHAIVLAFLIAPAFGFT